MKTIRKIFVAIFVAALFVQPTAIRFADAEADVAVSAEPTSVTTPGTLNTLDPAQELRENLALFHCQFLDCEKEAEAVFGNETSGDKQSQAQDPLADLSDFQTVTNTKFEQQSKDVAQLLSLREYAISQAQLAANEMIPEPPCTSGKCILVIISRQMTYAFQDGRLMNATAVSTGVAGHNTPRGTFRVYGKTAKQKMSGPGYYLPNVPWILWWSGDYSIHGTYWHHNFGHPMSHGCVNMPTPTAHWYFDWAPVGTPVIIR